MAEGDGRRLEQGQRQRRSHRARTPDRRDRRPLDDDPAARARAHRKAVRLADHVRRRRPSQRDYYRTVVTDSYEIQGRTITLPVEVRRARTWAAQFLVDATAASLLMPPGLTVARVAGRAMAIIPVARYEDGDLDASNEVGAAF